MSKSIFLASKNSENFLIKFKDTLLRFPTANVSWDSKKKNLNFGQIKRTYKLPGRPSMDILVRSWQDLAKILEKSFLRSCQDIAKIARCHGKILLGEPCSQENFYCKILFDKKISERKSTKINNSADLYC